MEKMRNGGGEVSDCYSTRQHSMGFVKRTRAHVHSKLDSVWRGLEMKRGVSTE